MNMSESDIVLADETVIMPEVLIARTEKRLETGKYVKRPSGGYECRDCGTKILATFHSVWDSPFPQSGTGGVTGGVPYCPKCEEEPDIDGWPLAPKGSYHNP